MPLIKHYVPIVRSSCISVRFKANYLGMAPTRSMGSCVLNRGCGLTSVSVFGSRNALDRTTKVCINVSEFSIHGRVAVSLRGTKLLRGRRSCGGGMNFSRHAGMPVRPGLSVR